MKFEKNPKWQLALSCGELKHYKDDIYYNVDRDGDKRYWKDGLNHRDDGPAIEFLNGDKLWYTDGIRNKLDGPAIEYCDGTKAYYINGVKYTEEDFNDVIELKKDPMWQEAFSHGELKPYKHDIYYNRDCFKNDRYWKNGKLHRDDGPAVTYPVSCKLWYKEGLKHRLDGPAIEYANGDKEWYKEGKRHRLDGPAVEYANGYKAWYVNGVLIHSSLEQKLQPEPELQPEETKDNSITFPISILTAAVIAKSFLANNKDNNKQIISKENIITTQNTNS